MTGKIDAGHLERKAVVYLRQSTLQQVASHRESQRRQRELVSRPRELGWPEDRVLVIDEAYARGMQDIQAGGRIVVLFNFHKSPAFTSALLQQTPPHNSRPKGVFSICSPRRPNPIGLSVVRVTGIEDNVIFVRGLDMLDGTPLLDIKPFVPAFDSRDQVRIAVATRPHVVANR